MAGIKYRQTSNTQRIDVIISAEKDNTKWHPEFYHDEAKKKKKKLKSNYNTITSLKFNCFIIHVIIQNTPWKLSLFLITEIKEYILKLHINTV